LIPVVGTIPLEINVMFFPSTLARAVSVEELPISTPAIIFIDIAPPC
jgi:hypothetical protein